MKLKPRVIDITALEWKGHEQNPEMKALVARYDLSGERYHGIGYDTLLSCCERRLDEHGYLKDKSSVEAGGVVCPGMWVVTEVNMKTSVLERVRALWEPDLWKDYEKR